MPADLLTAHQFRERLRSDADAIRAAEGAVPGYRFDVDRAVAAYTLDPEKYHRASYDNPDGDPVVRLILDHGPWWVEREDEDQ